MKRVLPLWKIHDRASVGAILIAGLWQLELKKSFVSWSCYSLFIQLITSRNQCNEIDLCQGPLSAKEIRFVGLSNALFDLNVKLPKGFLVACVRLSLIYEIRCRWMFSLKFSFFIGDCCLNNRLKKSVYAFLLLCQTQKNARMKAKDSKE